MTILVSPEGKVIRIWSGAYTGPNKISIEEQFNVKLPSLCLLADQFKLAVHNESREMPVYALVVSKGGLKCKESAPDAKTVHGRTSAGGRSVKLTWSKVTMDAFAAYIRGNDQMDRPVIDKTGLTGEYDIALTYVPENRLYGPGPHQPDEIDIFTAVREQLGLTLERTKMPVDVLVIDHSEKPSENE
jgi:uncharacterized protein (TIGR03435 family)